MNPNVQPTSEHESAHSEQITTLGFTRIAIENLRGQQQAIAEQYDGESDIDFEHRRADLIDAQLADYVAAQGVAEADDKHASLVDGLRSLSIDMIPEEEWYVGPRVYEYDENQQPVVGQDGEPVYTNAPSGQEKVRAFQIAEFGQILTESSDIESENDAIDQEAAAEKAAEIEKTRKELDDLRENLSVLAAKRQGRVFFRGKKYEEAREAYQKKLVTLGQLENKEIIDNEDSSELEKQASVIEYIFAEQKKLREATTEKLKGTVVGKFVEKMNKGNVAVRILKGIALGGVVSVAAAGLGAFAGVAGTAALGATVTALGVGAWRFARGFAAADARAGRGMTTPNLDLTRTDPADIVKTDAEKPDMVTAAAKHFDDLFEKDTKAEQAKRRKSVAWGLGGIAVGGVIGGAVHLAMDLNLADGYMNRIDPIFHDITTPDVDTPTTPDVTGPDGDGGTPDKPDIEPTPELDHDFKIQSGEGGIHFFQRLGLTESDWYDVQDKLLDKFPKDFYDIDGNGPTAVRITSPGQLSLEAQEYIKRKFGL